MSTEEPESAANTTDPRLPEYEKPSIACPHCGAFAQQTWFGVRGKPRPSEAGPWAELEFSAARCAACEEYHLWRKEVVYDPWEEEHAGRVQGGRLIRPIAERVGPDPAEDMPEDVHALYEEARGVASISSRSAAALLRLALEALLTDLYPRAGNLNGMIGEAVRAGLTAPVKKAMDVLRFSGNEAVHELRREDNPEVVVALFDLLNLTVTQLIIQPRRIDEMFEAMPKPIREQIVKCDGE